MLDLLCVYIYRTTSFTLSGVIEFVIVLLELIASFSGCLAAGLIVWLHSTDSSTSNQKKADAFVMFFLCICGYC